MVEGKINYRATAKLAHAPPPCRRYTRQRTPQMRNVPLPHFAAVTATLFTLALAGCATSRLLPASATSPTGLRGAVHGGQQPVAGAAIQLYAAGASSNGSGAIPLLNSPVATDAYGNFSITNDYACPSASSQVYITATGGNPGLPSGGVNQALALMTALGDCGALSASTTITINEVTTVAAAWALAPFATSLSHIAATQTNAAGLHNAFLNANLLADSSSGVSPSSTLPPNATTESAKIYALADLLAACVNSDGGGVCSQLFADATPAGATTPADTFALALTIAQNPTNNVRTLFNDLPPQSPFAQTLSTSPADWSVSVAYTGGGMDAPASVALDARGNVWVASNGGALSAFSPQGTPAWVSGITGSGLNSSVALAVDSSANVWVANMASGSINNNAGSLSLFAPDGTSLAGTTGFTAGNINLPAAIAADRNGNMWIANLGTSTVSLLSPNGTPLSGANGFGAGLLASPSALAINPVHQVWIANRNSGVLALMNASGNLVHQVSLGNLPDSLALDASGNIWVGDNTNSTLAELDDNGNLILAPFSGGGLTRPRTLVVDAGNHLWATNMVANTVSAFTAATPLTPATGLGADALMQQPYGAAVDASGSLWVTSLGDNRLVEFVGLATPTVTPKLTVPRQP